MMNGSAGSQFDNNANQIDEHDEPTEPMRYVGASPFDATVPSISTPEDEVIPSPQPHEQPFPQQQVPVMPQYPQPPQYAPGNGVYPYLPPVPVVSNGNRPAGGVTPVQPGDVKGSAQPAKARRSVLSVSVGMFFVAVQLLLLIRFILKLLGFSLETSWVDAVYGVSNVFVLPFRLIFLQTGISNVLNVEIYTLLAILVYSVISRIVVHILKALVNTR